VLCPNFSTAINVKNASKTLPFTLCYLLLEAGTYNTYNITVVFVADDGEEKLSLEADSKVFYFDTGENQFGDYLKISEVL